MKIVKLKIRNSGFTLTEIIVYISLLIFLLVAVIGFWIQFADTYAQARAEREVLNNARAVLERIGEKVSSASEIYSPTSRWLIDSGQLSLVVPLENDPAHDSVFADFWLDNGRVWMREEGVNAIALNAPSVNVSRFELEEIAQFAGRAAVKITLEIESVNSKAPASIILHSTTALRANY